MSIRLDVSKVRDVFRKPTIYKVNYPPAEEHVGVNESIPTAEPADPQITVSFDNLALPTVETIQGEEPKVIRYGTCVHIYTTGVVTTAHYRIIVNGVDYGVVNTPLDSTTTTFYLVNAKSGDEISLKIWADDAGGVIESWGAYNYVSCILPSNSRCYNSIFFKYTPEPLSDNFGSVAYAIMHYLYMVLLFNNIVLRAKYMRDTDVADVGVYDVIGFELTPIDNVRIHGIKTQTAYLTTDTIKDVVVVSIGGFKYRHAYGGIEYAIIY